MKISYRLESYLAYLGYHWGYSIKYMKVWYRVNGEEKFITLSSKDGNYLLDELYSHFKHYIDDL